jgi:hypothetical protein
MSARCQRLLVCFGAESQRRVKGELAAMFTERDDGFAGASRRRVGLVAAVAAALFAAALVGASGASALTFVHSATSGQLQGGRLILHGVGGRVSYTTPSGRTNTAALEHLHKGVFLPGRPATAILHVAGHRGGDEPSFRLSNPRYRAARRTLSFTVKPLDRKRLPGRANATGTAQTPLRTTASSTAAAQARSFGPSSLTVTPHASVAPSPQGGNECEAEVLNGDYGHQLMATSWSKYGGDSWRQMPPNGKREMVRPSESASWESDAPVGRDCYNTVTFVWYTDRSDAPKWPGTVTIIVSWRWGAKGPSSTCTPSEPPDSDPPPYPGEVRALPFPPEQIRFPQAFQCSRQDENGLIRWALTGPGKAPPDPCPSHRCERSSWADGLRVRGGV